MYSKPAQGMPAEEAVKRAHDEVAKVYVSSKPEVLTWPAVG
jgi:hypothetical protein